MEIQLTENDYCKLNVICTLNKEEIDTKRSEVLTHFSSAPVKGFRNKAPLDAIKMTYRSQINDALKRALMEHSFHETLFEKNIKPFGAPNFTDVMLMDHKFTCTFTFNSKPTFELAPYKEMNIPKRPVKETVEDLTQLMLQELRVRFGETNPYSDNDSVQIGDVIVVDYQAFDGETPLEAVSGSGEVLTVGRIGLPGFDSCLLGMQADETRSFTLTIPEGGLPSLMGKEIRFEVKLIMGSKNMPAGLDDELAKKAGKETFAQLVEVVAGNASLKHGEMVRDAHVKQISVRLLADNTFKVPEWLTSSEAQYLAAGAKLQWETMAVVDQERFRQTAEGNVKIALILDAIREVEAEAQLSDNEILEILRQQVSQSNSQSSPDEVLANLNQSGQLAVLASRIKDEHTLDFVLKNSVIGTTENK